MNDSPPFARHFLAAAAAVALTRAGGAGGQEAPRAHASGDPGRERAAAV